MAVYTKPLALSIKVLIVEDQGRVLMLKRSMNSGGNPGKWDYPGGKMDDGESFEQALLREVEEETGLVISVTGPLGTAQAESAKKRIFYLIVEGRVESGEVSLSNEHDEWAWARPDEIPNMDLAGQYLEFARDYAARNAII